MPEPYRNKTFFRMRVLSAMELGVGQLLANEVVAARTQGLTWKQIGEATGVSDSSANTRWRAVTDGLRGRPRQHNRRGNRVLLHLSEPGLAVLHEVLHEVSQEIRNPSDRRPLADTVRYIFSYRSRIDYAEREHGQETTFYLNDYDYVIRCREAEGRSHGSLSARSQWEEGKLFEMARDFAPDHEPTEDEIEEFLDKVVEDAQQTAGKRQLPAAAAADQQDVG